MGSDDGGFKGLVLKRSVKEVRFGSVCVTGRIQVCLVTTLIYISRLALTNERLREAIRILSREEAGGDKKSVDPERNHSWL